MKPFRFWQHFSTKINVPVILCYRFQPPDACYIELMRFRVRPPKNRELPFQLKAVWCVTGNKVNYSFSLNDLHTDNTKSFFFWQVELRADVLVPGFASRKLGQIPCEDVSIRFPIPECWIYLFRVEKHFRYVNSAVCKYWPQFSTDTLSLHQIWFSKVSTSSNRKNQRNRTNFRNGRSSSGVVNRSNIRTS